MDNLFQNPISITGDALFVTDTHFGSPSEQESRVREELLIALLNQEKSHIRHLFLLGDIFDFWFEYRDVVPKGNFRLFSTLYDLYQAGVKIYYFTGNHDMWVQDYFTESFGCQVFYRQQAFVINGKRCLVGHGDGIGGKQRRYLLIKNIFGFKPNRVLYSMLHPRQAFSIARFFSRKSRASHDESLFTFQGEQEFQVHIARIWRDDENNWLWCREFYENDFEEDGSLIISNMDWWNKVVRSTSPTPRRVICLR